MGNIDFLKKVLTTQNDYWIVAKRNEGTRSSDRFKDSIMIIAIPQSVERYEDEKDILLCDIEKLQRTDVVNIFLNQSYPPFQLGQSLYNIYVGYPIVYDGRDANEFLIQALSLKSDSIYDYKDLAEGKQQVKELIEN